MEILIDEVLEALDDGNWHDVNELSTTEKLRKVSMTKLLTTLDFLAEYFIERSEVWKGDPERPVMEVKLIPSVQAFVRRVKWVERSEKRR